MTTQEEQRPNRLAQRHDRVNPEVRVSPSATSCASCAAAGQSGPQPTARRQIIGSFVSGAAWTAGKVLMNVAIKAYNAL
ncbi:hypothetical protein [Streptomyces sp. NPDC059757]|uniref:hypothetical protein n=1 Tax=Streptomyces sp. NPDC059757 TaxID=3346935 RepID=UPI003668F8C8